MRLVFRTEGNHHQGMGDVCASLALADKFRRFGAESLFVLRDGGEGAVLVRERGFAAVEPGDDSSEERALESFTPDVVIVIKLNTPADEIRRLRRLSRFVVTVDDSGEGAKVADLAINVLYPIPGAVTGPKYISLRDEFRDAHDRPCEIRESAKELLVCQGGSDTYGFLPRIVRCLETLRFRLHLTVVVGRAFAHDRELAAAVEASSLDIEVRRDVRDMADLLGKADLAITAGGLTMFELCCVGTPAIVVCGERFEMDTARRLEKEGAVVNLGFGGDLDLGHMVSTVERLVCDPEARRRLSARGRELVDGKGCERMAELIRERIQAAGVLR